MSKLFFLVNVVFVAVAAGFLQDSSTPPNAKRVADNPKIDFAAFSKLTQKLEPIRAERRVPLERFLTMAGEANTIVLDTRSKWAFDAVHLDGATHLNFSDFSEEKLRNAIPSKNTRILIYCNNNFEPLKTPPTSKVLDPRGSPLNAFDNRKVINSATTIKTPSLALNIPTFINLWGYGYRNVYELADVVPIDDPKLPLSGSSIQE